MSTLTLPLDAKTLLARPLRAYAVGERWDPFDLFNGTGAVGAWYNISDLSTLFEDDAGTTPASLDGFVGLVKDLSGNDNHVSQATAAQKPILRQDAGGRYYLEFDGTDDRLKGSFSVSPTQATLAVAAHASGAVGELIAHSNANVRTYLRADFRAVKGDPAVTFGTALTLPITQVATLEWDNQVATLWHNGAVDVSDVSFSDATSGTELNLGAHGAGSSYLTGKIYGFVLIHSILSDSDRIRLEHYLAEKAGISL